MFSGDISKMVMLHSIITKKPHRFGQQGCKYDNVMKLLKHVGSIWKK